MANLDTSYTKYFQDNVTEFNAVRESRISNFHMVGTDNYTQTETIIVNAQNTIPLIGSYALSKDIARHFSKLEKDIIKCINYFNGDETVAYNKLNLKQGDALVDAHIVHMEDGIANVDKAIEEVKASLIDMTAVKTSLVSALHDKGFTDANTDMTFDELINLVEQI